MRSITVKELNSNTEEYLNLAYSEHEDILIKHKGRTYRVEPLTSPCRFTIQELKADILQSIEDINTGKTYSTEEVLLLLEIKAFERAKEKLLEHIDSLELIEILNIVINELEGDNQKPESLFKDKAKVETLLEKQRSFKANEINKHLSFLDYESYLPDFTHYAWEYIYKYFPNTFEDDIAAQTFSWQLIGLQWNVFKAAVLDGKDISFALNDCRILLKEKTIEP